jgi:hypothetical protein
MFGVHSIPGNAYGYSSLTDDKNMEKLICKLTSSLSNGLFKWLVMVLALSGVGGLGFFAGRRSSSKAQENFERQYIQTKTMGIRINSRKIVGTITYALEYNETFAESSTASNAAWKALIPHRGGFFNHPTIAPQRSVFSVFHELHCLVCLL